MTKSEHLRTLLLNVTLIPGGSCSLHLFRLFCVPKRPYSNEGALCSSNRELSSQAACPCKCGRPGRVQIRVILRAHAESSRSASTLLISEKPWSTPRTAPERRRGASAFRSAGADGSHFPFASEVKAYWIPLNVNIRRPHSWCQMEWLKSDSLKRHRHRPLLPTLKMFLKP